MAGTLVIIPAYEAGACLGKLLNQILRDYPGLNALVVDDGSDDNTAQVAVDSGAECLKLRKNQGKGMALRAGFARALAAGYTAVITLDADLQHDPAEIAAFLKAYDRSGALVVGVRRRDGLMPPQRRLSNFLVSLISSLLAGRKLSDAQCGFRLIPTSLLQTTPLTGRRYELEPELLIRASRLGYAIEHLPVRTIYNRNASFIRPASDTLRFLKMAFQSLFW